MSVLKMPLMQLGQAKSEESSKAALWKYQRLPSARAQGNHDKPVLCPSMHSDVMQTSKLGEVRSKVESGCSTEWWIKTQCSQTQGSQSAFNSSWAPPTATQPTEIPLPSLQRSLLQRGSHSCPERLSTWRISPKLPNVLTSATLQQWKFLEVPGPGTAAEAQHPVGHSFRVFRPTVITLVCSANISELFLIGIYVKSYLLNKSYR